MPRTVEIPTSAAALGKASTYLKQTALGNWFDKYNLSLRKQNIIIPCFAQDWISFFIPLSPYV